jgi:hypothetical protein
VRLIALEAENAWSDVVMAGVKMQMVIRNVLNT